jgi:hypothetical protein
MVSCSNQGTGKAKRQSCKNKNWRLTRPEVRGTMSL